MSTTAITGTGSRSIRPEGTQILLVLKTAEFHG